MLTILGERTMQDTRQQILEIMKRLGEVTVQDLSTELGLRQASLFVTTSRSCSEGYISDPEIVQVPVDLAGPALSID